MKANKFFKQFEEKAGECFAAPLAEAHKVKAGDEIILTGGLNIATRANEDGWQVNISGNHQFFSDKYFSKMFRLENVTAKNELPEGAKVTPVKKGKRMVTQPWSDTDLGVMSKADTDGFIVTLPETGKARFMSDSAFRATFKTNAAPLTNAGEQGMFRYIPQDDDEPVRFIVLDKETTFDFKAGSYTAPAGYVLYENKNDEDGFTLTTASDFEQEYVVSKVASLTLKSGPSSPGPA